MAIASNSTTTPEIPAPSKRALLLGGAATVGAAVAALPTLASPAPAAVMGAS